MSEINNSMWDIAISGAGPIGLTTAITAARLGMKVIIFEQGNQPGPYPRGETVHDHPIFSEVLGSGKLKLLGLHETALRRYNSPLAKKQFELSRKTPSIVFEWRQFIDSLVEQAQKAGVEIRTNARVVNPILKGDNCKGLLLEDGTKIYARTSIGCDGAASPLGISVGVPYSQMNCLMIKRLISGFQGSYRGFDYFLIPIGAVDIAPRFPPATIFIFPRDGTNCEVGLMVFSGPALKLKKYCDIPSPPELLRIWNHLIISYPVFSDLMKNTTVKLEYVTQLPMTKIYSSAMPVPGLILLGDSMGFVEASGGSGISAGMQSAKITSEFIAANPNIKKTEWSRTEQESFNTMLSASTVYKHINSVYRFTEWFHTLFFVRFRTASKINHRWWLFKRIMNLT